jgi:hypothetical protein
MTRACGNNRKISMPVGKSFFYALILDSPCTTDYNFDSDSVPYCRQESSGQIAKTIFLKNQIFLNKVLQGKVYTFDDMRVIS